MVEVVRQAQAVFRRGKISGSILPAGVGVAYLDAMSLLLFLPVPKYAHDNDGDDGDDDDLG